MKPSKLPYPIWPPVGGR